MKTTKSWLASPQVTRLLDTLYADAAVNDPLARKAVQEAGVQGKDRGFFKGMRKAYMAVGPEFGRLLYSLARSSQAKTVVEFGTSFGVSTIYLASAVRDNGGGKVITTEFEPEKVERAKTNLTDAGLVDLVEFRVGDALETLSNSPGEIDMVFLDGAKGLYLDVLQLLEPELRWGGIVASDNTDSPEAAGFLDYIRNAANGYISAAILSEGKTGRPHEITVRHPVKPVNKP